jgi:hypothetical protein
MTEKVEKKRSTYKPGNDFDFPEHLLDRKKYGYRWVAAAKFESNSDEYESRGWVKFKDSEGRSVRHKDCYLAQMPIDQYEARKEYKDNLRDEQTKLFFENLAAEEERASHDFKKKGGKVKFQFTQE